MCDTVLWAWREGPGLGKSGHVVPVNLIKLGKAAVVNVQVLTGPIVVGVLAKSVDSDSAAIKEA